MALTHKTQTERRSREQWLDWEAAHRKEMALQGARLPPVPSSRHISPVGWLVVQLAFHASALRLGLFFKSNGPAAWAALGRAMDLWSAVLGKAACLMMHIFIW